MLPMAAAATVLLLLGAITVSCHLAVIGFPEIPSVDAIVPRKPWKLDVRTLLLRSAT